MEDTGLGEQKLVKDELASFSQLRTIRAPYEEVWREIAQFLSVKRSVFELDTSRRGERVTKVYDGTAISAVNLMVNTFLGYLISRATIWVKLYCDHLELMKYPKVRQYFQDTEEVLYSEYGKSNFYETIAEIFHDGCTIGIGCIRPEEDMKNSKIVYRASHPKEIYIAENRFGEVDTVYRYFFMTVKQILEEFSEDGSLDDNWKKENEENRYRKLKVIHATHPRVKRDYGKIDNINKPFASIYILEKDNRLLRESGFDELDDIVWRYDKNTDEEYGRSPAWHALSDIKTINKLSRNMLHVSDYSLNPAYQYPGSSEYRINLSPGAGNPYITPDERIFPIELYKNYPIGREREEAIQEAIRNHFHVNLFMAFSQVGKQMTVPEVLARQGEQGAALSTTIGRINSELLDPINEKTLKILHRMKKLPTPPDILIEKASDLKFNYIGPLQQIQKRNFVSTGINQTIAELMPLGEINPEVFDIMDLDELAREIMTTGGMPQKVIKSEADVRKIRAQRARAVAQNQRMENIKNISDAAPKLNQKVQSGSMLEELNNQLSEASAG